MMIRPRGVMIWFIVGVLSLAACGGIKPAVDDSLEGTSWELHSYGGTRPISGTTISAAFADGHIRGSAGCNHYGAAYHVSGERITIGEIELTAMACLTPEGAMEQEQEFMRYLAAVENFKLSDGQLQLFRPDGEALTFLPPDSGADDPLQGTSWELLAFAHEQPIAGTTITAVFEDGQMRGSAGCNTYFGAYRVTDDRITISGLGMTEMACLDPLGVMDQELMFLETLGAAQRFRLADGELQIFYSDGEALKFRSQ